MRTRGFALDTAANALGTLIAAAVIYLVGVIAGVFTFQLFVAVLAPAGVQPPPCLALSKRRRISLLHLPWARIGEFVGQRNLSVTADTYTHVLVDEAELDYGRLLISKGSEKALPVFAT